ncbi:MAG: hypothetical protein E7242_03665 [Lachnospiraceae bacterium]|nr:hypothetical protein [Lachnospiraceae bacterium]
MGNSTLLEDETKRCNKFVVICHLIECVIISLAYALEYFKGARSLGYILITIVLALAFPIIELVIIKFKPSAKYIRYIVALGFSALYVFIILTTVSPLAFVYVIPMFIVVLAYNDYKYIAIFAFGIWVCNILQVVYFLVSGIYTWGEDSANIEIQILLMLLISFYMWKSGQLLVKNSNIRIKMIEEESQKTEANMKLTLEVSNKMAGNIEVVNKKMGELSSATISTKDAMGGVNSGANDTSDAVQKQILLTNNIQDQVEDVKTGAREIHKSVRDTNAAVEEGSKNIAMLVEQVRNSVSSGKNVTGKLEELKENMEQIYSVVSMIDSISEQTTLLSLNASIEAARAGESGRGFAVVASEISKMAEETGVATKQIAEMLDEFKGIIGSVVSVTTDMIEQIDGQNETTDNAAKSFEEIAKSTRIIGEKSTDLQEDVESLESANKEIIDSISVISSISEEVAAHANTTYDISETNTKTVEEISELIEDLSSLAEQLK